MKNPLLKKDPVDVVVCNPAACKKCGCTDRTNKQAVVTRKICGKLADGSEYTQVAWSYVNCLQCDARYRIIEYSKPKE